MKPIAENRNRPGFTLVELLFVIGITCILATIAIGFFVNPFKLPNGAEDLETLRMAITNMRNQSIMTDVCTTVTVNPATNSITTEVWGACSSPYTSLGNPGATKTYVFSGITVNSFNVGNSVVFVPGGGTNTPGTTATMPITAGGTGDGKSVYKFQLSILPAIGNIRIVQQ